MQGKCNLILNAVFLPGMSTSPRDYMSKNFPSFFVFNHLLVSKSNIICICPFNPRPRCLEPSFLNSMNTVIQYFIQSSMGAYKQYKPPHYLCGYLLHQCAGSSTLLIGILTSITTNVKTHGKTTNIFITKIRFRIKRKVERTEVIIARAVEQLIQLDGELSLLQGWCPLSLSL